MLCLAHWTSIQIDSEVAGRHKSALATLPYPGAKPDKIQVIDCCQFPQIPLNDPGWIYKGIAAGDQNVGDALMASHIIHGLVHPAVQLTLRQAYHPFPKTVTAVHGTLIGTQ